MLFNNRYGWFFWGAAAIAVQLYFRPLLAVDETRYLSVAWEMWLRNDFLVPYLNGEPYSHKPPLYFWLIQGAWRLTGVEEWSARLVAPVTGLLIVLQSRLLARQLWPTQATEIRATIPWLLFGGWFWLIFISMVQFDLLLTLMAMIAWSGLLQAARYPLSGWLLCSLGIGFGILSKGPVILLFVLPPAILGPFWLTKTTSLSWLVWYLRAAFSVGLGATIALAWAIPAGLEGGPAYQEAIFWGQSAGRIVDSFAHRSPWWSYLTWFPLLCLPWVLLPRLWLSFSGLPGAMRERGTRFLMVTIVFSIVLLSLVSGKQVKYLLPILPLVMLLFARLIMGGSYLDDIRFKRIRTVMSFSALLVILLHVSLVAVLRPTHDLGNISQRIADLQSNHIVVARLGAYHGRFHFSGRLKQPVISLPYSNRVLMQWLEAHPDGVLTVYDRKAKIDVPEGVFSQPYRRGRLVLWPAEWLRESPARLDALLASE
ncbi:MAG: glycosyltransferase family 39 protein [Gammaproteobacteria bacterium]